METSYGSLANFYDQLTCDVDYVAWADYLNEHLKKEDIPGNIVLDLACGTGSLTFALADLGYEMIGVDLSPDMLSQAMEKSYDYTGKKPLFLCQSMEHLDLFGTIDACVSCLDSINYVVDEDILRRAMERVFLFLMDGGIFLFDVKTPKFFSSQDGQLSLDEKDDVYCVWKTEMTDHQMCTHYMDLFQKQGKYWLREEEVHHQRVYSFGCLEKMLLEVGFSQVERFGNLSFQSGTEEEERVFFLAKKGKTVVL